MSWALLLVPPVALLVMVLVQRCIGGGGRRADTVRLALGDGDVLVSVPRADIAVAARTAAAAFAESPWFVFIFGGDGAMSREARVGALTWLFARNFEAMERRCPNALLGLKRNGEFAVFFMLVPPGHHKLSLWEMVRAGLPLMAYHFGWAACRRLLAVTDYVEHELDERVRAAGFGSAQQLWQLQRMVVLPKYQGMGLGSRCLGAAIDALVPAGQRCVLSTNLARNVTFYKRLGFAVFGEFGAPARLGRVHSWLMSVTSLKK